MMRGRSTGERRPGGEPRPQIEHIRRPQLLDAAAGVIAERGIASTRIADVAERAGTSPPAALYWVEAMVDRRLFALVGALVLAEVMFYAVLTPLLPYYTQHLGLSKSGAGLLSAFYAFGAVGFSVPAGFLVGRIGARPTVLAGVALLAS